MTSLDVKVDEKEDGERCNHFVFLSPCGFRMQHVGVVLLMGSGLWFWTWAPAERSLGKGETLKRVCLQSAAYIYIFTIQNHTYYLRCQDYFYYAHTNRKIEYCIGSDNPILSEPDTTGGSDRDGLIFPPTAGQFDINCFGLGFDSFGSGSG